MTMNVEDGAKENDGNGANENDMNEATGNIVEDAKSLANQLSKPAQLKRKKRHLGGGSAILSASLNFLLSNSNEALEIMKTENNARTQAVSNSSIDTGMNIINRMVNEGSLWEGGDL
ncbi:hypothetical protein Sjap_020364 [Stephania japonica]|uniref:Uncharacterized protein n=1 Tax=Stephania japonica TaxID=461633 RepID=A0AAP0I0D6_9MAGN